MKILICGNLGYIGPTVVRHLRRSLDSVSITGLDTGYFATCITTDSRLSDTLCDEQIFQDIRDIDVKYFDQFDAIVLLAAISNDPMGKQFSDVTDEINNQAISRIVKHYAALSDKTIVFASSCSMYGAGGSQSKSEHDSINPLTAYARSKVAVETVLENVKFGKNSKATSLRFATACGMTDRLRLDLVLNDFVASAVITNQVTVLSDGSPWRPLIDVQDMARAIEWAINRDMGAGSPHLAVNVGSDAWNYTVRELAETVVEKIPDTALTINSSAQPDKRSYKVDFSLFRKLAPMHQPQATLTSTIDALVSGILPLKNTIGQDIRASRFVRLHMLQHLLASDALSTDLRWTE